MKITEYTGSVSEAVKDKKKQNMIKSELTDHIIINQEFFEEIGYDSDTAQRKAVECMGDAESIGDRFAQIYNKNKTLKRIIYAVLLMIICYINAMSSISAPELFNQFTCNAFLCFVLIFYAFSFIALNKKDIWYSITAMVLFAICTYPIAFDLLGTVSSYTGISTIDYNKLLLLIGICLLFSPAIVNCVFTISYNIKARKMKNSRNDLRCRKILEIITGILTVISLILLVSGTIKITNLIPAVIEQRENDYNQACEISEKIAEEYNSTDKSMKEILKEHNINIISDDTDEDFYLLEIDEDSVVYWYASVVSGLSSTINEGHRIHVSIEEIHYSISPIYTKSLCSLNSSEYELIEPLEKEIG